MQGPILCFCDLLATRVVEVQTILPSDYQSRITVESQVFLGDFASFLKQWPTGITYENVLFC